MTRDEAIARAQERNALGAGAGFWAARERDGAWEVVQAHVEGVVPTRPSGSHAETWPRADVQEDPRPAAFQNVPPFGAA